MDGMGCCPRYLRYSDIKTMSLLYEGEDFDPPPSLRREAGYAVVRTPHPACAQRLRACTRVYDMSGTANAGRAWHKSRVKSALRLPALREAAAPAKSAAFAELQKTAAIRAFGAETEVILVAALGAIG